VGNLFAWIFKSSSNVPYRLTRVGHQVFAEWLRPIESWSDKDQDDYMAELRSAVRASIDEPTWNLISRENRSDHEEYQRYVREVREKLIEEYSLQEIGEQLGIGLYHGGLLVLSWPVEEGGTYPYYYHGVQLKPYKRHMSS